MLTARRGEASRSCKAKKVDCAKVKKKFKGEKKKRTNCTFLLPIQDCSRVNFTVHHLNTPSFSILISTLIVIRFQYNTKMGKSGIKVNIEGNNIYFCTFKNKNKRKFLSMVLLLLLFYLS